MTIHIKKYYCSLSEAIRAGSLLRPQCAGQMFTLYRSCAIGAAIEAVTGEHNEESWTIRQWQEFAALYAATFALKPECPVQDCLAADNNDLPDAGFVITHLNDYHSWTREKIADWVETLESALGFETLIETEASPELSLEIQDTESQVSLSALTGF